ncbi:MAG: hypothetical protein PHQ23_05380 [Candidatus Wallbacteria bacterium]|nr:hypothetical protein [Candidatus Wallbacteria bacterium]
MNLFAGMNLSQDKADLQSLISEQFSMHSRLWLDDVFVLIRDGVFGSFNRVRGDSRAMFLLDFAHAEEPLSGERMLERISPLHAVFRVNLRVFKGRGGTAEVLYDWFHRSSRERTGDIRAFFKLWGEFERLNREVQYFPRKEVDEFRGKMVDHCTRHKELPEAVHSQGYRDARKPCYRVVCFKGMLEALKQKVFY